MSFKGGTFTIVVNKKYEIISVTCDGKPMVEEGDGNIPIVGRDARGVPADIKPPQGYSGCICLGQPLEDPSTQGSTCVWKWGKLF